MVEIAKALSFASKLIIMDEPTSSLTGEELVELAKIIRHLKERGISIIYISHKLAEIFEFCDVVSVMRDGRVIDTKPKGAFTRNELIAKMVGRTIENEYPPRPKAVGAPLLEVRGLETRKLHGVSFTLRRGEILGLVGLVGAGRTEILRLLFGLARAESGRIELDGHSLLPRSPVEAIGAGLALVPEDRKTQGLVLDLSVRENITLARVPARIGVIERRRERHLVSELIARLKIRTRDMEQAVRMLSGGNQQKVVLARWLALRPRVLLLDEPTRGVDVGGKAEIYELINALVGQGAAIVMVSSELPEVLAMSDRILVMHEGRATALFDAADASQERIMLAATRGP
jgi:ribose transport system ATP-binding protein